jgi:hypothetical protein
MQKPTRRVPRTRCAALETLESRWTPSWSGVPPVAITPPTNATGIALNSLHDISGSSNIAGTEVDYYSFTAPVAGSYRFATNSSAVDTVLGVFSSTGQRLAYNDDINTGVNTNSQVSVNLAAGSRYFVGITNYTGGSGGNYGWLIDGPANAAVADDRFEANDSLATATPLGALTGSRTVGSLVMLDAADWFSFTLNQKGDAQSSVGITFKQAQGDLDLALYNANGDRLAVSQGVGNGESIPLTNRVPGTYYLRVYGYLGVTNPSYSLELNGPAPLPDLRGALLQATDTAQWGKAITVQAAVQNGGSVASGAFQSQFWLSRDRTWSSDDIILTQLDGTASVGFAGLAAGAKSATASVTVALPPQSVVSSWAGSTFYIVMRTDSANQVAESNETNNSGQVGSGLDFDPITIIGPTGGFQITLNITGMTSTQQAIFQQAANRWSQVIVGDLPNATYNGRAVDDLLIDASGAAIDGPGGVLGQAGPDSFRAGSLLPIHGSMEFDTADLADMQADGTLFGVILHEMGHVLGIGTIWDSKGLLVGAGTSNPLFIGAQATAEYNRIFGTNASGVPVENGGGAGTRDSHWRESILNTEIMTGYVEAPGVAMPLSRITVGSLADIGYQVNMAAADAYTKPTAIASLAAATSGGSNPPSLRAWDGVFADLDQPGSSTRRNGRLAR